MRGHREIRGHGLEGAERVENGLLAQLALAQAVVGLDDAPAAVAAGYVARLATTPTSSTSGDPVGFLAG